MAASSFERWKTRRFASWIERGDPLLAALVARRPLRAPPRRGPSATSPACAPPIPSATAKSGGAQTKASSFRRRRRPGVRHDCHAADHQTSTRKSVWPTRTTSPFDEAPRRRHARSVDEGAVRRADVLDPEPVAPRLEASVLRGGELVAVERDLVLAAAADRHGHRVDRNLLAGIERRALDDDQPGALHGCEAEARGLRRPHEHALLRGSIRRRSSEVAARAAHDPPDEEIEEDDEGDLEDQQRLVDVDVHEPLAFPKTRSVAPSVIVSPSDSLACWTRLPFSSVPFVESRSTSHHVEPSLTQLGVPARDVRVLDLDVAVLRASEHGLGALDRVAAAVHLQRERLLLEPELGRRGGLGRLRRLGLVDHRRARLDLRRGLVELRAAPALGLHHPRRDPELADREVGVRLHQHGRRRQHRVALAPGVLDEVVLQLPDQRALVARELLAVGLGEVDRVLVRDVDARDRDRPVLVHLLRQLSRQLDRLDVRPEGTAEHPLEEAFDLLLDGAEDAHAVGVKCYPRRATLMRRLEDRDRRR